MEIPDSPAAVSCPSGAQQDATDNCREGVVSRTTESEDLPGACVLPSGFEEILKEKSNISGEITLYNHHLLCLCA